MEIKLKMFGRFLWEMDQTIAGELVVSNNLARCNVDADEPEKPRVPTLRKEKWKLELLEA